MGSEEQNQQTKQKQTHTESKLMTDRFEGFGGLGKKGEGLKSTNW